MKTFYYLQLLLCLCESVFVNSNYIQQSTEIAQFAKQHSDIITEKNLPLHYQLALQDNNQGVTQIQGPTWKSTPQGIYLEEPKFYEVPVKASILVAPLHYQPTQHVKQINPITPSLKINENHKPIFNPITVNLKYVDTHKDEKLVDPNHKKKVNYQELSQDKPYIPPKNKQLEVNSEASKNYKQYANPKDPYHRKIKKQADDKKEPSVVHSDKHLPVVKNPKNAEDLNDDTVKFLKDEKIRDLKKKSKKIKKEKYKKQKVLEATGTKKIEQIQKSDPEEKINEEFHKIHEHSDLPREHKKEQQYLIETTNNEPTTFKTPIDDEFERLSQENLHFVHENLFGDKSKELPPRVHPSEINDLNSNKNSSKEATLKEGSNKKEVRSHGHTGKKEEYNKKSSHKSKDNKHENSGNVEHHTTHDEKNEKSYDDKHTVESKNLKDRSKELYKGKFKDEDKNKKKI